MPRHTSNHTTFLPDHLRERVTISKDAAPRSDQEFVLCWLWTALRDHENPALDTGKALANQLGLPVLVYQELTPDEPFANDRHATFALQGARDLQTAFADSPIPYLFHLKRQSDEPDRLVELAQRAAAVVTDHMPVAAYQKRVDFVARNTVAPLWQVDSACVVPMQVAGKAYDRAFKYRNSTKNERQQRLTADWPEQPYEHAAWQPELDWEPTDLQQAVIPDLVAECDIDHAIGPVEDTPGGMVAGYARWNAFKEKGLRGYAKKRNNALLDGVSRMSAYLHHGMVSPFRIAREAAMLDHDGAEKYIDELVVWRELAYTFNHYRPEHDTVRSLPTWALETLRHHQSDQREAVYSWERLARGETHDGFWNAAQKSLLMQGELHNNVRMTWGKAVLNWTETPERALDFILDLNHRYALDGRDPASYGGILWCLGQFDRPFTPEQDVIGTVRPRPTNAHAKRLDPKEFAQRTMRYQWIRDVQVAVVGSGIGGLTAARTLRDHGIGVTVFDKGRDVGGRTASRETDYGVSFDLGAQYFTARHDVFKRYVDSWIDDGVVAEWPANLVAVDSHGNMMARGNSSTRYVGTPDMRALARHLANDVEVRQEVLVTSIERAEDKDGFAQWKLMTERHGREIICGPFDFVLLNPPAPQAATLLQNARPTFLSDLGTISFNPCWAVGVGFTGELGLDFQGIFINDDSSPLAWASRNDSKPGWPGTDAFAEAWVLHATADWTNQHWELSHDEVTGRLVEAFFAAIGKNVASPAFSTTQRWRYAQPQEQFIDCHWDAAKGLGACGDWCLGGRVEGAFRSGLALAGRVMGQLTSEAMRPEMVLSA